MLTDVTKSFVVLIVHLWELHMKGIGWQCDANDTEQETAYTNALHMTTTSDVLPCKSLMQKWI